MLKSNKSSAPAIFVDYFKHNKTSVWEDIDGSIRKSWREYILNHEQNGLSAYTEEPCDASHSHIDHFRRRTDFPKLTFEWSNFIVDGVNANYGAKYKDDTEKHKRPDYNMLINPAAEEPQYYFEYTGDGMIEPRQGLNEAEKERAIYTKNMFNLNHPALVYKRKLIFDTFAGIGDSSEAEDASKSFISYGFPSVVNQILRDRKRQ